jgi:multidrug efflux pump
MTQKEIQAFGQKSWLDLFSNKPIIAVVISLTILLVGLRSVASIPVLQFPQIDSASIVITTPYIGASAEVVQGFITDPIERAAAAVPGVDYVDSATTPGLSRVTVWLNLNVDSAKALAELSARIDQIRFELPEAAEDPAIQVVRADRPFAVFYLTVNFAESEGRITRTEATDFLQRQAVPVLSTIPGVQRVGIEGGRFPAMRIWLDHHKMQALNISASEVTGALRSNNLLATLGQTENNLQRLSLVTDTNLADTFAFETLVVAQRNNNIIRLRDIAKIELGEEEGQDTARLDENTVLYLSVWPVPGANEIAIGDEVYERVAKLNTLMPAGMSITDGYDGTLYMRAALKEILGTLAETILIVGAVVLLMMGSIRTALVPLVTIPISILGALAVVYWLGFSINLLTVLAIVLSVGLVVDDAIVVVENVGRHMRNGMGRIEAALISSRQLFAPVVVTTVVLAAVYAPIGILGGLTGALFKEFAFTLAIAVILSCVVAVTLSPIMSAYSNPQEGREGWLTLRVNRVFDHLRDIYTQYLRWSLTWRGQIIFMVCFVALLSVPFYLISLKELAPTEDQSSISVIVEAPPEASIDYSVKHMDSVVNTVLQLDGSTFMWQLVNPGATFGGVEFVAPDERARKVQDIYWDAFFALNNVPGLKAFPVLDSALPTAGNFAVELVVQSNDSHREMQRYVQEILARANATGEFLFVDSDLKIDQPLARIRLDNDKIALYGMSVQAVTEQLGTLLSGNFVNRFDQLGKAYRVIPMVMQQERASLENILSLPVSLPSGDTVPFTDIASIEIEVGPRVLSKFQQQNAFRVFAGTRPDITKEAGLSRLEEIARDVVPSDYLLDYAGESREIRRDGNQLEDVLILAILFVFLVLSIQFNSFRDPLVVLLGSVPVALSGALMFTFLDFTTINIYSQVGFITLVGLVAKNGILIVEFAKHMQEQGLDKLEAITQASQTRLRPVLMTTTATVLGHLPLLFVTGAGAEARNSIGIILVAGMLVGTLLTLLSLPTIYMSLASERHPEHNPEG